jgi:hypothetical protein
MSERHMVSDLHVHTSRPVSYISACEEEAVLTLGISAKGRETLAKYWKEAVDILRGFAREVDEVSSIASMFVFQSAVGIIDSSIMYRPSFSSLGCTGTCMDIICVLYLRV